MGILNSLYSVIKNFMDVLKINANIQPEAWILAFIFNLFGSDRYA